MPKSQLEWKVEWNEPKKLPVLTERLHKEGLGREDLIAILESRNEELVHDLCGQRYSRVETRTYRRAGTRKRVLGTRFGKIAVKVNRIVDTSTGISFVPLWSDVLILSRRIYQEDVLCIAGNFAGRMTYRNSNVELSRVVEGAPSPHTINRAVIEYGQELNHEILNRELTAQTHQPDGTKLHAQSGKNHNVNLVLATCPGHRPRLRSLTVGKGWDEHIPALEKTSFQDANGHATPPTVVSDMERGLASLLTPLNGFWQPCLVHVPRTLGFELWRDGVKDLLERRGFIHTAVGLVRHLKNSLELHLSKGENDAIVHRIKQTQKEFRRLSTNLFNDGKRKAASFLRRISNAVTTFAQLALQGITIPWHNNVVERLMGEVSKRCKHKWMSWTSHGAQALLTLIIVRTVEPDTHDAFWNRKLFGDACNLPNLGVSINRLVREC